MKSFLSYLYESHASITDPYEIMVACCCLLGKSQLNSLLQLDKAKMDNILLKLSNIAKSDKLVGENKKEINAISISNNKYTALCLAISAAKAILAHYTHELNYVIMTGRSWHKSIQLFSNSDSLKNNFNINDFGIKGFNSSDIVLTDKTIMSETENGDKFNYLGVSLKKKGVGKNEADPTLTNISVLKLLSNGDNGDKIRADIEDAFNTFYNKILNDNAENFCSNTNLINSLLTTHEYKSYLNNKNPTEALKADLIRKCKSAKLSDWKRLLSVNNGLMRTRNNRKKIHNVINKELGSAKSVFKTLLKVILNNSTSLANDLIKLIYRGDLSALINNNFDFGICTGKGDIKKTSNNGIESNIQTAKYLTISSIAANLSKLHADGYIPNLVSTNANFDNRDDKNIFAANLTFDLNIDEHTIAKIVVRYKGDYTSSPSIMAVMSEEFKNYLNEGKWKTASNLK